MHSPLSHSRRALLLAAAAMPLVSACAAPARRAGQAQAERALRAGDLRVKQLGTDGVTLARTAEGTNDAREKDAVLHGRERRRPSSLARVTRVTVVSARRRRMTSVTLDEPGSCGSVC